MRRKLRDSKKRKEENKKDRNRIWKDKYKWRIVDMGKKEENPRNKEVKIWREQREDKGKEKEA